MTDVFLTEPEAAEILRCSTEKVKRLRLSGRLTYLRGRPVLIRQSDLDKFVDASLVNKVPTVVARPSQAQMNAEARQWALNAHLFRPSTRATSKPSLTKPEKPARRRPPKPPE